MSHGMYAAIAIYLLVTATYVIPNYDLQTRNYNLNIL